MKIVVTVASLHGGGAEYVARTWMGWLARRGHHVQAVLTGRSADPAFVPEGVQVRSLAGHAGQFGKVRALRAILRQEKPDVALSLQMHSNLTLLSAARLLAKSERPRIFISERNLVSLGLNGADRRHRLKVKMAKWSYRKADGVVAISHPVAGELVAGFRVPGQRIYVVPNPATAKVSLPSNAKTQKITNEAADLLTIVLPCRLVAQKRPELALSTAAELTRRGIKTEVRSFGDGPLLAAMTARAQQLGVRFDHRGWVENWYEAEGPSTHVVLLPSSREGFGNVLVEAAAAGLPSVAVSGALGVADAVVPGITGELALTADPADLADAVLSAARVDLSQAVTWLERFSEEKSGRMLEQVLSRVGTERG
ncbi:glycosyltransferase [Microbacterium paludicola]|uniref:glycosyltransferase n=1 Tax=Microbacterium paludicola TaxID=300019 RepID=UPI0011A8BBC4|nr:glycosyltransferase [Microbacterium paludicola]